MFLLRPLILLGPSDISLGWLGTAVVTALRQALLLALSVLLVTVSFWALGPKPPEATAYVMVANQMNLELDKLGEKLGGDAARMIEQVRVEVAGEGLDYTIQVRVACEDADEGDHCLHSLLDVRPLKLPGTFVWLDKVLHWFAAPFRTVAFEGSPYLVSALVTEMANEPMASADERELRRRLDPVVSGRVLDNPDWPGPRTLPSPDEGSLIWTRRLVGWIQIACYVLFAYGLLRLGLTWVVTNLPTILVQNARRLPTQNVRMQLRQEGKSDVRLIVVDPQEGCTDLGVEHQGTVWSPFRHRLRLEGSPQTLARLFEDIQANLRRVLGGPIAVPPIPATALRRVGYLALHANPTGEAVPGFVSVEAESFFETFDAQNRIPQFVIWAIPTLGFVGTVIGIGDALGATVDVQSLVASVRVQGESSVGSKIGLAFDTTFVSLVLSFILMLTLTMLQSAQEGLISLEKRRTLAEILHPQNVAPIAAQASVDELLKQLRKAETVNSKLSELRAERTTPSEEQRPKFPVLGLAIVAVLIIFAALFIWFK